MPWLSASRTTGPAPRPEPSPPERGVRGSFLQRQIRSLRSLCPVGGCGPHGSSEPAPGARAPRGRSLPILSRARAFRAAALACLLLAVAAHAHADVLVSNIGQSDGDTGTLRIYDHAQGFTTGRNAAGYAVTSVDVKFAGVAMPSLNLSVGIRSSDSHGNPDGSIGTFMNPDSFSSDSVSTFTASGSGIALEANTKYFVVVNSSSSNGDSHLRNTARDSEDPVDAAGWTIDDVSRYKTREDSATWSTHPQSKMIRINGTEVVLQPLGMPRDVSAAAPERIRGLDFSDWIRADEIEVTWLEPFIGGGAL